LTVLMVTIFLRSKELEQVYRNGESNFSSTWKFCNLLTHVR